jgi:hypothetical protein
MAQWPLAKVNFTHGGANYFCKLLLLSFNPILLWSGSSQLLQIPANKGMR